MVPVTTSGAARRPEVYARAVPTVRVETFIAAPPALCFDLARDVGLHTRSAAHTGERAVAGTTAGLLSLGDQVTWEARHFGLRWRLTARITVFEPPRRFVDEQVRGPFRSFAHTHDFQPAASGAATVMVDDFRYAAPLGPLGRLAGALLLSRHLRRFLARRADFLKEEAERRTAAEPA
jgi:ligand-binding SRPBCC domain-containing protein